MSKPQAKHWCLTINNFSPEDEEKFDNSDLFTYTIYGKEVAPDTGTPHLQAFVSCQKRLLLTTLKHVWPTAHFEIARGTPQQASEYCKKEGDYYEFGICPDSGPQTIKKNWDEAKALAIAGKLDQIQASIYVPYIKNLQHIAHIHQPIVQQNDALINEWHWGPTGMSLTFLIVYYSNGPIAQHVVRLIVSS